MKRRLCLGLACLLVCCVPIARGEEKKPVIDCYISTGDNQWVGSWLPIDSKAAIEASFDMLKDVYRVRRIYWRGLEEAAWMETAHTRPENCRYSLCMEWFRKLYAEVDPDRVAVDAAHKRGMEIWGVGTLFDWGCQADAPCFGDYPHFAESRLRIDHPDWVPVDRRGLVKQGGPIELAYPEARRAVVDVYVRQARKAGYDGVAFMTYCENYSTRFQDEFGFNEPILKEFKKRYGVDLRTQDFARFGSRFDWYQLRGEYVTQCLREMKDELRKDGKKLGMYVNSSVPHRPQPWNVPELVWTAGDIYMDLEGWIRDGIVDDLMVYGYCSPGAQDSALKNCLWMARQTGTEVSALTSSPFAERWAPFKEQGVPIAVSLGDEEAYLDRSDIPEQPVSSLTSAEAKLRMRVLAQIIAGKTKASVAEIAPLAKDQSLIMRRLALKALGKTKDPQAVPILEEALDDPEHCIRTAACWALWDVNRPETVGRLLAAVEKRGTHPLYEEAVVALTKIRPLPREVLAQTVREQKSPKVRMVAMRALRQMATKEYLPDFVRALKDEDRYVRYEAAYALGLLRRNPQAAEALIEATRHEDAVVSDRAAVSLGEIAARKEVELAALQPRIVECLKVLYAKLGDGCQRADAEWGYRPVGNALLACGAEGEGVLKEFMAQTKDRRLADSAWRTVYIRQRPGTFSEISEKENDEAYKMRPAWLDK